MMKWLKFALHIHLIIKPQKNTSASVEDCGIHSLRHTFASKLYELTNGDSKLVSSLIRHSSVSFTEEIYIHLTQKYKHKVIANFNI